MYKVLRYGETRVSITKPNKIPYWIEGIEISVDSENAAKIWSNTSLKDSTAEGSCLERVFTLPLSRNLNCFIGGRGSGKSAAIEAVSFLTNNSQYSIVVNREKDWYKRSKSTLQGCKLRLCWKLLGEGSLPKKALIVSGYFDPNNKYRPLDYSDINEDIVLPSKIAPPSVDIFRIHDIEEAANPIKLREIFDDICGSEILVLTEDISKLSQELKEQHQKILDTAKKIVDITKYNEPIREYARRKYDFDKVDEDEIKKQYSKIDQASYAYSPIFPPRPITKRIHLKSCRECPEFCVFIISRFSKFP